MFFGGANDRTSFTHPSIVFHIFAYNFILNYTFYTLFTHFFERHTCIGNKSGYLWKKKLIQLWLFTSSTMNLRMELYARTARDTEMQHTEAKELQMSRTQKNTYCWWKKQRAVRRGGTCGTTHLFHLLGSF